MKDPTSFAAEPSKDPRRGQSGRQVLVLVNRSIDPHVVVYHEPQSLVAEQYRSFRTNLTAMNPGGLPRALAFTSAIKGEGKTITVVNLGAALAELPDTRILVVDADLRAGRMASLFKVDREPGLSDLMIEGLPLPRVLIQTLIPNLSVLPAGRPVNNPTELLGSTRIHDLISAIKAEYHYVLFDTPATLPYTDASVLGSKLDGVILVVRMDKTPKDQLERTMERLKSAGGRVIGTFLTGSRNLDDRAKDYRISEDE